MWCENGPVPTEGLKKRARTRGTKRTGKAQQEELRSFHRCILKVDALRLRL